VSWSIVSEKVSCYGTNRRQKVLTEQDVTVICTINFYTLAGSMNISSVVLSSDTATDSMTDFEKVDRVRRRCSADASSGFQVEHTRDRSESVFSILETSVFEFNF